MTGQSCLTRGAWQVRLAKTRRTRPVEQLAFEGVTVFSSANALGLLADLSGAWCSDSVERPRAPKAFAGSPCVWHKRKTGPVRDHDRISMGPAWSGGLARFGSRIDCCAVGSGGTHFRRVAFFEHTRGRPSGNISVVQFAPREPYDRTGAGFHAQTGGAYFAECDSRICALLCVGHYRRGVGGVL